MQALRGKAGVITAVMVFGLTYGLTAPLVSLRLSAAGYSEGWIGLNAAMHAVGVFAIAPLLPPLLAAGADALFPVSYFSHARSVSL